MADARENAPISGVSRYDFLYSNEVVLAGAIGAVGQLEIRTQQDSVFVVQTVSAIATAPFTARFTDDGSGVSWQNQPIYNVNTFGSVQRPNILIKPIMVFPTSKVLIDLVNLTAVANTVEIVLGGYKIFQPAERPSGNRVDLWFQYAARLNVLGGNADSMTIQLQADSWFEVQKVVAVGYSAAYAAADFSARISDSGLGKSWSDRFIRRDNQFGTAEYPRVVPFPKLMRPNSTVQIELRELSGAPNTIEVVLEGVKKYSL